MMYINGKSVTVKTIRCFLKRLSKPSVHSAPLISNDYPFFWCLWNGERVRRLLPGLSNTPFETASMVLPTAGAGQS